MKLPAAALALSLGASAVYAAEQEPINVTRVGSNPSSAGGSKTSPDPFLWIRAFKPLRPRAWGEALLPLRQAHAQLGKRIHWARPSSLRQVWGEYRNGAIPCRRSARAT